MCFFRRRDLPNSLIVLADKHQMNSTNADDTPISAKLKKILIKAPYPMTEDVECNEMHEVREEGEIKDKENSLNWKQRHQLKHRELFLSRQVETLPATHIRGKCSVTLLNETESVLSYLNKDDTFFYCLVFDPAQKTLLADKGEIRVGNRYQAEPMPLLREGEPDSRNCEDLETLVWTPGHQLTDRQIDQFLVISRSVGTFARALDCSSSVKQPSLHMSAAAASRDVTLFHAMDTLHNHGYNLSEAISRLVPSSGPVLCRDEMEEWSASEANLFEEALEKYVMNNSKGVLNGNNHGDGLICGKSCESCQGTSSSQWYAWGSSHTQYKLCHSCWIYWKKYGGLKNPSRLNESESDLKKKSGSISDEEKIPSSIASHRPHRCTVNNCGKEFKLKAHLARHYATAHGVVIRSGSPRPIMKTRTAFYLHTTPLTRLSRRLCRHIMQPRHAARSPFWPINVPAIKQECQTQMSGKSPLELKELLKFRKKDRGGVTQIANRLGDPDVVPEWLLPTDKNLIPKSLCIMFPKPPKGPDGSLLYERVPNKPEAEKTPLNSISPCLKRRAYDENGLEGLVVPQPGPPAKRPNKEVAAIRAAAAVAAAVATESPNVTSIQGGVPRTVVNQLNGQSRPKVATMTRTGTGRKGVISWMDAPDDVYFRSTVNSRKMRRQLSAQELRRASRKPWRKISIKGGPEDLVVLG
ncbi:conserved hypothetical protein [Pediculus humanus corporis]|uniref:Metastasis-associated protein MTA1 n=1 Tax=Pediculus humanus subsp. corporis TaxID=121224 RepID=E0VG26_PEDHC|nr:uncharacterized protein Phum_PHUM171690 [Pediculus humanus corporis]EEB12332.1 conserved hypothetical protein [Pediculus humanus corporis]